MEHAAALRRAPLAEGEQAAEAAVGGTVARIAEEREPAGEIEPRACEQPQTGGLRCDMGAHRAGEGVAIGDTDGGEAQRRRALHQLIGVGGAAQEAEVAHRLQLGVGSGPVVTHVVRKRVRWRGPNDHLPLPPSPKGGGGTQAEGTRFFSPSPPLGAERAGVRWGCLRSSVTTRGSSVEPVHVPAGRLSGAGAGLAVEAGPVEPVAPAVCVLDAVVIAHRPRPACRCRPTIPARCARAPAARMTRRRTRRQVKSSGGPSGTSAITSTGSGRSNRRKGRCGRCGRRAGASDVSGAFAPRHRLLAGGHRPLRLLRPVGGRPAPGGRRRRRPSLASRRSTSRSTPPCLRLSPVRESCLGARGLDALGMERREIDAEAGGRWSPASPGRGAAGDRRPASARAVATARRTTPARRPR